MNNVAADFDATSNTEVTRACESLNDISAPASLTLNIDEILDLTSARLKDNEFQQLMLALYSIQKRINHCEYHYSVLEELYGDPKFALSSIATIRTNGIELRTIYEANILAFLQNLHALIDSLPYSLNIAVRKFDIDDKKVGWNKDLLKSFKDFSFYSSMSDFYEDKVFDKLKQLVNKQKHKHLVMIRFNHGALFLEEYPDEVNDGKSSTADHSALDAKQFLASLHDDLVPKYIHLWYSIRAYLETVKTEHR